MSGLRPWYQGGQGNQGILGGAGKEHSGKSSKKQSQS
jgi:hypothetical protein